MLQGLLSRLEGEGNPVPRLTLPRCLRERQAVGGCEVCAAACPHDAVALGELGHSVEIDPGRCTGCGLCVQSCPTGALEYPLDPPLLALRDQRDAVLGAGSAGAEEEGTLTCARSGAGGPQVPCLGRVTPGLLAAAGAWNWPLTLLHGECAACPVGSPEVPARLEAVVQAAARLRAATPRPARVTVRAATSADAGRSVRVSRRAAFGTLLRGGKAQLAHSLPAAPLPFVDWSVPEERAPQEWRWRWAALKGSAPADAAVPWPAPVVDDTCIDCPVCANVCPTEALTRDLRPDGGVALLLNLEACTGCLACLRSCPPQAIHEQPAWLPAAFAAPILLRESDSVM